MFDITCFIPIPKKNGISQADPFVIEDYIFFEQFNQTKGIICYYKIGEWIPRLALETEHHLSYPQVFKHEGEYYLLPEAGTTKKITLYKAKHFPDKWEPYKVLYEGEVYADPTLYYNNAVWYLFFTSPGDNDLTILKSNSLDEEFKQYHVDQYINSRGAGNIFAHEGKIIRPTQDNTKIYGGALVFKEITLNPYSERIIHEINPWGNNIGIHTWNHNGKWIVVDSKYETEIHPT